MCPTGIPIGSDAMPKSPHAGATVTWTITLDQANSQDTAYPLYSSNPTLLTLVQTSQSQPSAQYRARTAQLQAFPASVTIPAGANQAILTLGVSSDVGRIDITVAVGDVGADMSNPNNWAASDVLRVYP